MNHDRSANRSAVILVGHGTRDPSGTEQFFRLGDRLRQRLLPMPVQPALLEFQSPTISEAWGDLVRQGSTHIHVAPLLLFSAGHAKDDVPQIARQCQSGTPHVSFDQSRPLSRHASLIELAVRRINDTLRDIQHQMETTALVIVGRGNRDVCAQADLRVMSEVIARRVKVSSVFPAFYAMAKPTVPEVIGQVVKSGRFRTIIIHPHLLFAGRLMDAISQQVDQAAAEFTDINFHLSQYLGPDPLIADAIAGRIDDIRSTQK